MADYTVRIIAETKEADDKVKRLDQRIEQVTRDHKINISIPSLQDTIAGVKELGSALNTAYKIARVTPVIGGRLQDIEDLGAVVSKTGEQVKKGFDLIAASTPGNILGSTFSGAISGADALAKKTANLGYTIFGVTQSVNMLKAAFGSLFDDTVGREIRLQESLLRTKSTLVSTADVAVNGKRIADPLKAITALEGPINDTLESIRLRSLDIAGTTSDAIVQVFGVVASQIGNVGGDLKDAEDLAITFSAALGTLGLSDPMYASQEIRSILTGTIDQNSVLARSLGLTNEDVDKAKRSADGLVVFLQKRLEAFTAGQSLAAKGFAGIISNIEEFQQELKRAFGRGLLQPLLEGLTVLYERLQVVFKASFGIADALGKTFGAVARGVVGAAAAAPSLQQMTQRRQLRATEGGEQYAVAGFLKVQEAVDKLRPQIASLTDGITKAFVQIAAGLKNLAEGFAVFKFEQFKVYLSALTGLANILSSTVVPAFSELLKIYGEILKNPIAQYLNQLGANFDVLNRVGIIPLAKTLFVLKNIIPSVLSTVQQLGNGFKWLAVQVAGLIDYIATGFAVAISAASTALANIGRTIVSVVTQGIVYLTIALKALIVQIGVFLINISELALAAGPQFGQIAVAIAGIGQSLLGVEVALDKATLAVAEFGLKAANALDALQLKTEQVKAGMATVGSTVKEKIGQAGEAVKRNIGDMIKNFIIFSAQLIALQIIITVVFDYWQRWQRGMKEISDQTRAELAVKRLSTAYADVGENATAATKAAKAFEEAIVSSRIDAVTKKIGELSEKIRELNEAQGDSNGFTRFLKQGLATFNPENMLNQKLQEIKEEIGKAPGNRMKSGIELIIPAKVILEKQELAKAQRELNRLAEFEERQKGNDKAKEEIQVLAKERNAMEKEVKELRKNLTKEITDFEWNERQKSLELEQQMREAMAAQERQDIERRQQEQNKSLGELGSGLKQIFDEYETALFDAQVESQKRQSDLALKRNELEKQVSDYRYRLEEQTLKLRERMGQLNKKIVDYESQERLRASKEVLRYALQAAAVQGEDFVVTPDEKTKFMNAAAKQGVSAERVLALLKLGAGRQFGFSSSTNPEQIMAALKENYPVLKADGKNFEAALNDRSRNLMGQSQGGTFALQTAREELGTGRWLRSTPKPPGQLTTVGIGDIESNVNRMQVALAKNLDLARQLAELATKRQSQEATNNFISRLSDPGTWGVATSEIGNLNEQITQMRNDTEALVRSLKEGITDPSALQRIAQVKTQIDVFFTEVFDKLTKQEPFNKIRSSEIGRVRTTLSTTLGSVASGETSAEEARKTIDNLLKYFPFLNDAVKSMMDGVLKALANAGKVAGLQGQLLLESIINEFQKQIQNAQDIRPALESAIQGYVQTAQAGIPPEYSLANANMRSDLNVRSQLASSLNRLTPEQKAANPKAVQELVAQASQLAEEYKAQNAQMDPLNIALYEFEQRTRLAGSATEILFNAHRGLAESFLNGSTSLKDAMSQFSKNISSDFVGAFLDYALAPMKNLIFEQMKSVFKVQSAQEQAEAALQKAGVDLSAQATSLGNAATSHESAASALVNAADALKSVRPDNNSATGQVSTGLATLAPIKLPVQPYGGYTLDQLEGLTESDQNKVLEQAFAGYGNSMMKLTDVATTTGTKAQEAANQSEKGFNKFLGGMMGVATGALAIAGGISQLQEGGTSNTLAGIGSILLGLGGAVGGLGAMGVFGKKAGGGPIASNRPYLVGENGPELMFSGTNGTMVPNNRIREAMGSSANGGSGSPSLNMTFQTTSIGGVEYVSREQLEEAMASTRRQAARDGAKRGMSMTLDRLQQSPGTRSRLGLR